MRFLDGISKVSSTVWFLEKYCEVDQFVMSRDFSAANFRGVSQLIFQKIKGQKGGIVTKKKKRKKGNITLSTIVKPIKGKKEYHDTCYVVLLLFEGWLI